MVAVWLTCGLNSMVDIEQVPACLKQGIAGGGKEPLKLIVTRVSFSIQKFQMY